MLVAVDILINVNVNVALSPDLAIPGITLGFPFYSCCFECVADSYKLDL